MRLTICALTPELWPDLENLFGPGGASNGCWCMYWRIGPAYHKRAREKNKEEFRAVVNQGPPPGLLAFAGKVSVGWCQFISRDALPRLNRARSLADRENGPVWSLSCFYIRRGYRRKGIMSALIAAAIEAARSAQTPVIEAYPVDTDEPKSTSNLCTGVASTFAQAGFKVVDRLSRYRLTMRLDLQAKARSIS